MRNTGTGAFDLAWCSWQNFAKQKSGTVYRARRGEGEVAFTFAFYRFILRVVVDICRTRPRETYRGQFAKRASDVSIAILRRGGPRVCGALCVNSYRKLIQDNYHDETLKHINCRTGAPR